MICPRCQHNQDDSIPTCQNCNFAIQVYFQQVAQANQLKREEPNQPGFNPNNMGQPPEQPGFNPNNMGQPPEQQGFNPNNMGQPPEQPGFNPNNMGQPPEQQGFNPNNMGKPPEQQGFNPNNMGQPPKQQGFNPNNMGQPPEQQGFNPNNMGKPPEQQGFNPNNMGQPYQQGFNQNNVGQTQQSDKPNSSTNTLTQNPIVKYALIGVAVITALFFLLIIIGIFADDSSSSSSNSVIVDHSLGISDSYYDYFSTTVKVGTAFDNFFSDGKWSNYESLDQTYVRYEGYARKISTDQRILTTIIFYDFGDTFRIKSVETDEFFLLYEDYWDQIEIDELFDKIYSNS